MVVTGDKVRAKVSQTENTDVYKHVTQISSLEPELVFILMDI